MNKSINKHADVCVCWQAKQEAANESAYPFASWPGGCVGECAGMLAGEVYQLFGVLFFYSYILSLF